MAEAKLKRAKRTVGITVPVVRDATFHRAVVDRTFMLGVGDELEIACLQMGSDISSFKRVNGDVKLDAVGALTEVVRLRMSWEAAVDLSMNILMNGIRNKTLDVTEVAKQFSALEVYGADDND